MARQGHDRMQDGIGNGSATQELHSLSRPGVSEIRSISCSPGTGMTTKAWDLSGAHRITRSVLTARDIYYSAINLRISASMYRTAKISANLGSTAA